jgi:hypothetical protein
MAGALTPSLAPAAVKLSGGRRVNRPFSAPIGPPASAATAEASTIRPDCEAISLPGRA